MWTCLSAVDDAELYLPVGFYDSTILSPIPYHRIEDVFRQGVHQVLTFRSFSLLREIKEIVAFWARA